MATIQIRAAEPRDVEAIAEIWSCPGVIARTLQLPFRSIEERRERLAQRSPDAHLLVAEFDGQVVGIAVHDDFQGRGVGSALMAALVVLAETGLASTGSS
jgi:putative acetyltransferase